MSAASLYLATYEYRVGANAPVQITLTTANRQQFVTDYRATIKTVNLARGVYALRLLRR